MRNGSRYSNLDGKFTSTVYGLIRDGKYVQAIKILSYQLQLFPRNRAALSLIGYCQYYMQDFLASAQTYELLVKHHPSVVEYKLYYAQSLLKAGMHAEANKIATQIDHPQYTQRIQHLKACIAFEQGELETCKALIERNETMRDAYHLCIVNLVIGTSSWSSHLVSLMFSKYYLSNALKQHTGTLYCSKGNFEFGISRIIKSLEPYDKKLGTDTWFYAKRCFVALAVMVSKQMFVMKDTTYYEVMGFLEAAENFGRKIPTKVAIGTEDVDIRKENVSKEARLLKRVFLRLVDFTKTTDEFGVVLNRASTPIGNSK